MTIICMPATYTQLLTVEEFECVFGSLIFRDNLARIKMALSRGMAYSCIVFGFVIVALSFGCIAAGAVAISKLNEAVSSIGLWAIYVSLKLFCLWSEYISTPSPG